MSTINDEIGTIQLHDNAGGAGPTGGGRRIVGYQRVSTAGQTGERHVSLETQALRIEAHAARDGSTIVASFTDVASGRKDDRPEYQRMLDFVSAGNADVIVIQFLDRFGRNPQEILLRIWALRQARVSVEVTDEDIGEELVLLMRAGLAGAESKRTGERVRAALRNAIKNGSTPGVCAYGYKRLVGGGFEVEPHEAEHVRRMAELFIELNYGFNKIAEVVNAEGRTTRKGNTWSNTKVAELLHNPAIMGTLVYGTTSKHADKQILTIEGFYDPPVLDPPTWKALQTRLAIRRERSKGHTHVSKYVLSGTARCGYCGGPIYGHPSHYRGVVKRRYECDTHARKLTRANCDYLNSHLADRLEAAVLDYLEQYTDPQRVIELLASQATTAKSKEEAELARAKRDLVKLDDDLKRDVDLLGQGTLDRSDFATVNSGRRERRAFLSETVERLSAQLTEEKAEDEAARALPERIRTFFETARAADPRLVKAELQMIVKAVYITRETIEVEFRM